LIIGDFFVPPVSVVFGSRVAARTTMPKTTIDKNRQFEFGDHQIRRTWQGLYVPLELDFFKPQCTARTPFNAGALGADSTHVP
jgi:hypothetical protein